MRFPRLLRTVVLASVGLVLAACGSPAAEPAADPSTQSSETITVQTNQGEVRVPVNPARVVALDNTSFATLQAMGITPVAVPKPLLPPSLQAWADDEQIADAGSHREPRLEAINAAKPDLIIGGKRFADHYETLTKIAPVVDLAPNVEATGYVDALKQQTTTLGEIFGSPEIAEQLNADLDEAVAEASALTSGQSVFLANHNGGKIDNGAGRMAPLIEPLNLTDVFAKPSGGSDSIHQDSGLAPETIAQANPDWMIVMDRDAIAAEGAAAPARATVEAQEAWRDTTFATENQVFYLDPEFYVTESIQAYTAFYTDFAKVLGQA